MRDRQGAVTRTSTITRASLVCLFLAVVLLSAGCTSGEQPPAGKAADPDFRGETLSYDDRVVFRLIPEADEAAAYSVTCTIERDISRGTTIETRANVLYENISRGNPIEIVVPREDPSDGAAIEIEIRSTTGEVQYRSRTSVAPAGRGLLPSPYPVPRPTFF
ncbi:hypothetical protein [Methanoculleus sp.]|uniref:hypothetical protein n=1 Tax=Methanoculleus sp. TaxID=90427 RepID=UPI001BD6B906|nr:hypothetical protein [Methanoculleus sp.]